MANRSIPAKRVVRQETFMHSHGALRIPIELMRQSPQSGVN